MIVTIDGPAGAGKTSVSRAVAERLGMSVLDTGAMYRTCALATIRRGGSPDSPEDAVSALASSDIRVTSDGRGGTRMLLDGEDVTDSLHTPEIDAAVTPVCQVPRVREAMTALQRDFARKNGAVCEGRDMGTVVFPDAEAKVWLTAVPEERARRRAAQFGEDYEQVLADIVRRDEADAGRGIAPMVKADDAVVVDTTDMTEGEAVNVICAIAASRM